MEQKIKSISEAYSMQPCKKEVCLIKEDYKRMPEPHEEPHIHNENCIVEIKLENLQLQSTGGMDLYKVYNGYNKDGQKLFEYLANSVNVEYYYQ
jgi:hypothetical protein